MTDILPPTELSPYIDYKRTGGNIELGTNKYVQYLFITLLLIFILFLLFKIYGRIKFGGEDYYQRQTHHYFNNLHGETFDDDARLAIEYGEAIMNPRAMDNYRVGTAYLINANNPHKAYEHYNRALEQIINGNVDIRETPFILERIDDYKDRFTDFPEIEELPLQRAMMVHFEAQRNLIEKLGERKKEDIAAGDPDFTQKLIISRQKWQSDPQNVHDETVYDMIRSQFHHVREENNNIPEARSRTYHEAVNWLRIRYNNDPEKKAKLEKVITVLNNDYPVGIIPGVNEREIITNVWRRMYHPENKGKMNALRDALGDAVLDCVEGNTTVCLDGRVSKIWQALARIDYDEDIGVLKSKQSIRNEIYERAAKIVDDHVGSNGVASDALKEAYNRGEQTEQVKEVIEVMRSKMDELGVEYAGMLQPEQLRLTIEECKAVV
jgi:hypothetical protein